MPHKFPHFSANYCAYISTFNSCAQHSSNSSFASTNKSAFNFAYREHADEIARKADSIPNGASYFQAFFGPYKYAH